MVAGLVVLGFLTIALLGGVLYYLAQPVPPRRRRTSLEPPSMVRVLRDEEDLKEAVGRAIAFEETIATTVSRRLEHYRRDVAPSVGIVSPLRRRPAPASGDAFPPERSA